MDQSLKLIFVYNADSGLFNSLSDFAHKLISPKTYQCNLCAVTYGAFSMKESWKEFLETLEYPVEFLHRNELQKKYGLVDVELPSVFLKDNKGVNIFVTAKEINACNSIEALKKLINSKLQEI